MNSNQWKKYKLEEVSEIIGGGTPSTTNPDFWGEEIPWITPRDLASTDERFISCGERCITKKGLQNSSARLLPAGTVLLTTRAPIGYLRIALNPICTNQGFKSLIPKADVVDNQFLFYLLKNNVEYLKSVGVGTTFAEISGSTLRQIEFPFPPLPVQRRIADILSALDDKIELNRQTNATLEAIAQAIFKEWFVDFNFPGATGELVESELGMIPKGWMVDTILAVADLLSGGTPSTKITEYWNGDIKWISAKDVSNSSGTFILDTERNITRLGVKNSSTKILPKLTTIVTARGTVGSYCILSEPMAMNQTNYGLKAKEQESDYFVFFSLANLVAQLKQASYGTIFDTVTTTTFEKSKIIIPPFFIIQKFDRLVKPIMETILGNIEQSKSLSKIRDSILPKLMNGEINFSN